MEMVATSGGVSLSLFACPRPSSNAQKESRAFKQASLGEKSFREDKMEPAVARGSCRWVQLWIASKCPATAHCDDRQGGKYLPGITVDPSIIIVTHISNASGS